VKTPKPPRPPERKGRPMATATRNNTSARKARRGPTGRPSVTPARLCQSDGHANRARWVLGIEPKYRQ